VIKLRESKITKIWLLSYIKSYMRAPCINNCFWNSLVSTKLKFVVCASMYYTSKVMLLYPMSSQERCRSMLYVLIINRVRLNHQQEYVCTTSSPSKIKLNQDTRNTHSLLVSVIIFSQSPNINFFNLIFVVHMISFSSCRLPAAPLNAITNDPSKLFLCWIIESRLSTVVIT
jgi:hypothetical protein